jgi:hypothetical protein
MRHPVIVVRSIATAVLLILLTTPAALADSEAPPSDTTGRAFVLVIVGLGVLVLVLLSAGALRKLLSSRSERPKERHYEQQRDRRAIEAAEVADVAGRAADTQDTDHPEAP